MGEQLDNAIEFFENEIKQYNIILKGILSDEYRNYVENIVQHYQLAIYALNELL